MRTSFSFLCCGSMAMTVLLDNHGGHNNVAHVLVLFFWIGGGYGLLSYVKVKVNKVRGAVLRYRVRVKAAADYDG